MTIEYQSDPNHTFTVSTRCPSPDCASPLPLLHEAGILGKCGECGTLYESVRVASIGAQEVEWARGGTAIRCTFTGIAHQKASPLEWTGSGGNSRRTFSPLDPNGVQFGTPDSNTRFRFEDSWRVESIAKQTAAMADHVSTLTLLKGHIIATSTRGWIAIIDAQTGKMVHETLAWPSAPPPVPDTRPVYFPPVGRGTNLLVCALHQSIFIDLAPCLDRTQNGGRYLPPREAISVLDADQGFIAPPLAMDGPNGSIFCLTEGQNNAPDSVTFRFFRSTEDGFREVVRLKPDQFTRGPIFDDQSQRMMWLDDEGNLQLLALSDVDLPAPSDTIPDLDVAKIENHFTNQDPLNLRLRPLDYATFSLSRLREGRSELVALSLSDEGQPLLWRAPLEPCLKNPTATVEWSEEPQAMQLDGSHLMLSVGDQSSNPANRAGDLIGVGTDGRIASYSRGVTLSLNGEASGNQPGAYAGTYDPPVTTGAGVVARTPGMLHLFSRGIGWSVRDSRPKPIASLYKRQQGLLVADSHVYFGDGLGVCCLKIVPEEI